MPLPRLGCLLDPPEAHFFSTKAIVHCSVEAREEMETITDRESFNTCLDSRMKIYPNVSIWIASKGLVVQAE